ncbi:MAG: MBL fold metallo-hydrolase [Ferrimicrobium sp.]
MKGPLHQSDIHRLDMGYVVRPGSETANGAPRVEPVFAYLLRHPDITMLFDTGIGAVDPETEAHYRPRRISLESALHGVGCTLADIDVIANSHLHFDHCGANPLFGQRRVWVQASELQCARGPDYTMEALIDFPGVCYEVIDGRAEIATGLTLVPTPGHSVGHQSLVAECEDGTLLIAGQATDFASEFTSAHLAQQALHHEGEEVAPIPPWMALVEGFDPRRAVFAHDMAIWESD